MNRQHMIDRLEQTSTWDMVVVGGGATGVGIAVDAASRGYEVALIEQHDFGKGTSSRSTKLAHGGVRYLEQGNISLVMEALKERGLMRQNAPHLVSNLAFVVPNYDWWEAPFYGLGLKVYNVLAGKYGFGSSEILSREETLARLPTIKTDGLLGGVVYYDGQFDDARLLVNLVQTAIEQGATAANYVEAVALTKGRRWLRERRGGAGRRIGPRAHPSRESRHQRHRPVFGSAAAAGGARRAAADRSQPGRAPRVPLVVPARDERDHGAAHERRPRDVRHSVARPHRRGHDRHARSPSPRWSRRRSRRRLRSSSTRPGRYLDRAPTRADVLSVFVGIRPLVKSGDSRLTAALSRDHTIHIDASGLLTTTGGKWTTYRHMAEATVDQAADLARLPERPCVTRRLNIHGFHQSLERFGRLSLYGSDAPAVQAIGKEDPILGETLDAELPYTGAEVTWAVRQEMALTVEDVLARRCRALFLNARAAARMAPAAAALVARERGKDEAWARAEVERFTTLCEQYTVR